MTSATLSIRVRPIRVAFVVLGNDRAGLRQAIECNSLLWGGAFNPIIPLYRRLPSQWNDSDGPRVTPSDVIKGYLDSYDPDIVVPVGACSPLSLDVGDRKVVSIDDLLGDELAKKKYVRYGIGLYEILSDIVEKEFKYIRNDDLKLAFPKLNRKFELFLGSVFGMLSRQMASEVSDYISEIRGVTFPSVSIQNFTDCLSPENLFIRRVTGWTLNNYSLRDPKILICDATSSLDILDYWNLRAAGQYVIPIPIQATASPGVLEFVREFIERNYRPFDHNPEIFNHTTVIKGRSVINSDFDDLIRKLDISSEAGFFRQKLVAQRWYPRLWDIRAQPSSQRVVHAYSYSVDTAIPSGESAVEVRTKDPKLDFVSGYGGAPKFANDLSFRFVHAKEPMAEVFPEGKFRLADAIGGIGFDNWRLSRSGPVFLSSRAETPIYLELPRAETVMVQWLQGLGWEVNLSPSGRMASQLLKQLGGIWGTSLVSYEGIISLFSEMAKEKRQAGMARQEIIEKLNAIVKVEGLGVDSGSLLKQLIDSNALRLGAKVQCPICTRHNWFELGDLRDRLKCSFCLSEFDAPVHEPKTIQWSYRAHGPFAGSAAQGAISVLLVLRFLGGFHHHDRITPLLSYTAKKAGTLLEADLTCLYRESGFRAVETLTVHAECKSYNTFEQIDVQRMKELASQFPGSALVFATFRRSLTPEEKLALRELAEIQRTRRKTGERHSLIIILTGTELFSMYGAPECWNGKSALHDALHRSHGSNSELESLSDATQQLYLEMSSMADWWATVFSRV